MKVSFIGNTNNFFRLSPRLSLEYLKTLPFAEKRVETINLAAKNESQNRPINNEEEEKKKTGQADQLVSVSGTVQFEKFGSVSNDRLI